MHNTSMSPGVPGAREYLLARGERGSATCVQALSPLKLRAAAPRIPNDGRAQRPSRRS